MNFNDIKLGIVTFTVGNWELMDQHLKSIYDTYPFPKNIYLLPNLDYKKSLSALMNRGFRAALSDGCDYLCYSADDTILGQDCLQTILNTLEERQLWYCGGSAEHSSGWDTFILDPVILSKVGYWDEGFYPAYFEDNDWYRRIMLVDPLKWACTPAKFVHLGSQTIANWSEELKVRHREYFRLNRERFTDKWGGPPKQELYTIPWDGQPYDGSKDPQKILGDLLG